MIRTIAVQAAVRFVKAARKQMEQLEKVHPSLRVGRLQKEQMKKMQPTQMWN